MTALTSTLRKTAYLVAAVLLIGGVMNLVIAAILFAPAWEG